MRIAILTLSTAMLAAPVFAADLGTYRPGTPYHSVIVPTANVCESQCEGDARCRGWNYVKPAPNAAGVCEFQSQVGAPVSSAISISGVSASAAPMSNRLVSGGTNTVRVGTTVAPKAPASHMTSPRGRTIVREAVPQRPSGYPTMTGSVAPVRVQGSQTAFSPMLDGMGRTINTPDSATIARGPARQAPQTRRRGVQAAPPHAQIYQAQPVMNAGRPPIGQAIPAPSASAVPTRQPVVPTSVMPRASVANPVTQAPRAPSLYGSLHDDVRQSGAVQPMPTAQSRPTTPISQSTLAGPPRN